MSTNNVIATDIYNRMEAFFERLEGKDFPSIYQDSDSMMYSFQVESMGNLFQTSVQATQVEGQGILVSLSYSFMVEPKKVGDIIVMGVPIRGVYTVNDVIAEVKDEQDLFSKTYVLALDHVKEAVHTILE
ncbi:hypothetical protein PQC07_gp242 [Aeromonas phage D3]|uniref:Uncharacterized protein n=2 Tax=Ludhianavirus TaxID=3044751 RepID=A0A514TVI5_9CAUD|nr:hypothetical protein PQC07_gp242 [Aeromonas phage D3]YP_010668782.1 hypothetical protein PQC08_gp241 [Aeromonas phage D6]QDJ97032.1 hypothetical protein D3_0033 [Aeromonas phage D3]QDJ97194.1 hypothetical protein D6_0034 [Aeromonas phage D6]QEP52338.1 hypothetical protein D9_0131 [Aeromonas phage D9]